MDARQQDALVRRLVQNPQDQGAIAEAHAAGQQDPEGYARLLEQVGLASQDRAVASHWLNEAANVWETTFQDKERAANVLAGALDRDPTSDHNAARLAEIYTSQGDRAAVVTAMQRRADALADLAQREPDWRQRAAELFQELGRACSEAPASDVAAAKQAYSRAIDLDPTSQFSIYSLRELHKGAGELAEALPYFGMEIALVTDAERKLALLMDEAEVAKAAARFDRAVAALSQAVQLDPENPTLKQQLGSQILENYRGGLEPSVAERQHGAELFVGLAEAYPGEHGFLYALCALELNSTHDRAMQLSLYFGEQLGRVAEAAPLAAAYVRDNPNGVMVEQARHAAGNAVPPPQPKQASKPADKPAPAGPKRPAVAHRPASVRPPPGVTIEDLLERGNDLATKSRKNEAIAVYRQALVLDPVNPDALNYLLEQLPIKRKYGELKDVLLGAIDSDQAMDDDRLGWLRDLAGVCESHVRDVDTAVYAWQRIVEIDAEDDEAVDQIKRLLEKARRWDELAHMLEVEARETEDLEVRIALEKNLAKLHSTRRKDLVAAGEAWGRIASLSPGDDAALSEAVKLLEKGERSDLAADVIADNVQALDDDLVKRELYLKLGDIRVAQGQALSAAESLAEGADELGDLEMWARAEEYFAQAQAWEQAANAADEQASIAGADADKAALFARAANYCVSNGDSDEAIDRLEQAVTLAPSNDEFSKSLEELLVAADRVGELVQLFLARASKMDDMDTRVALRKRAASVQRDRLGDATAARATYAMVLEDREDPDTLEWLAQEAESRGDAEVAVDYLRRLTEASDDVELKTQIALHEAELCAQQVQDPDRAVDRYEYVLEELNEKNEVALERLADLETSRGNHARGVELLERYLEALSDRDAKLNVAFRLAELYEVNLAQPDDAIRLLSFIHEHAPDDVDATARLCALAESVERWQLVADLTVELISVEQDPLQVSDMTRRLAEILHQRLEQGADAMAVLGAVADQGDEACRQAFVELGDEIGEKRAVARRILSWYREVGPSAERDDALVAAFDRLVESKEDAEAVAVAKLLLTSSQAQPDIGETLERLAVGLKDREGLSMAHELRANNIPEGPDLADERVRQAEVISSIGVPAQEAIDHGESALSDADSGNTEALLARLAALTEEAAVKVDVYERHIARLDTLHDRLAALCRAADVAAQVGDLDRSRSLFDAALSGGLDEDALEQIVQAVRAADEHNGGTVLRQQLAEGLANGGQAARDGGRSRARMLRLAAVIAQAELDDLDRAFQWLGDGLILHVEDAGLDALEEVAGRAGDYRRAEAVLERALEEVFDGPLVRRLLNRRATLREDRLDDLPGAADDLKRLHDLSPSDAAVNERLVKIYETLGEHRGIVALLEDQILRNRDKELRAELSRRVAKLWQDELGDPREAADAWRRVLRLSDGDEEAKQGLAAAKEAMLAAKVRAQEEAERAEAQRAEAEAEAADTPEPTETHAEAAEEEPVEDDPAESDVAADESPLFETASEDDATPAPSAVAEGVAAPEDADAAADEAVEAAAPQTDPEPTETAPVEDAAELSRGEEEQTDKDIQGPPMEFTSDAPEPSSLPGAASYLVSDGEQRRTSGEEPTVPGKNVDELGEESAREAEVTDKGAPGFADAADAEPANQSEPVLADEQDSAVPAVVGGDLSGEYEYVEEIDEVIVEDEPDEEPTLFANAPMKPPPRRPGAPPRSAVAPPKPPPPRSGTAPPVPPRVAAERDD